MTTPVFEPGTLPNPRAADTVISAICFSTGPRACIRPGGSTPCITPHDVSPVFAIGSLEQSLYQPSVIAFYLVGPNIRRRKTTNGNHRRRSVPRAYHTSTSCSQKQSGLYRCTIYSRIAEGLFTRPVSLRGHCVGWLAGEVVALNAACTAGKSDGEFPSTSRQRRQQRRINPQR
jgi:predicted DNA-binding transcriptional regulator AlpA